MATKVNYKTSYPIKRKIFSTFVAYGRSKFSRNKYFARKCPKILEIFRTMKFIPANDAFQRYSIKLFALVILFAHF